MRSRGRRNLRIGLPTVMALGVGALLATLAFSHAAASVGVAIDAFRPLGGNFFALRSQQTQLLSSIGPTGEIGRPKAVVRFGQSVLEHSPLSPRPAWLLALGYAAEGNTEKARKAMLRVERISQREPGVQLWLATDLFRRGDPEAGMRHFDTLLRSASAGVSTEILARLAPVLAAPEAREALAPYARRDNPWYGRFIETAARDLPEPEPAALFLIELRREAPSGKVEREAYTTLMQRLAQKQSYTLMTRLYPLLPGANAAELRSVAVAGTSSAAVYPPIGWDLANANERGGGTIALGEDRQGLEFFAATGTTGTAGRKLLMPGVARVLRFRIADRTVNPDASANWVATCVGEGSRAVRTQSTELMSAPQSRTLTFDLPASCPLVRLEMRIAGGTGREPSSITVEQLELARAS